MFMVNIKEKFKNMTMFKQIHVKKRRKGRQQQAYYFKAEGFITSERKESRICQQRIWTAGQH